MADVEPNETDKSNEQENVHKVEKQAAPEVAKQVAPEVVKSQTSTKPDSAVVEKKKIDVLLKAAGDAPIMKKKKWAVDANKPVAYLSEFIRKYIRCEPSESLFIYVNQTFVPSPDQVLSNLFECFGTDGKLVLHYCKSQAWG